MWYVELRRDRRFPAWLPRYHQTARTPATVGSEYDDAPSSSGGGSSRCLSYLMVQSSVSSFGRAQASTVTVTVGLKSLTSGWSSTT